MAQNLEVGKIYNVAGHGWKKLTELTDPPGKTTLTFQGLRGPYWASPEQICSEAATPQDLKTYLGELRRHNLAEDYEIKMLEQWIAELEIHDP